MNTKLSILRNSAHGLDSVSYINWGLTHSKSCISLILVSSNPAGASKWHGQLEARASILILIAAHDVT